MNLQSQIDPWSGLLNTRFFIAGFEKCGTTSLHAALADHPEIIMSNPKEPKYFEAEYHLGMEYYRNTYFNFKPFSGKSAAGEARPHNAVINYVPDRIGESCPNSKIIFLLRNPIERAYSGWRHWQRMRPGREPLDFDGAIQENFESYMETGVVPFLSERDWMLQRDPMGGSYKRLYIEHGCYHGMMEKYYSKFDCIALPFEYIDHPEFMKIVLEFLEVDDEVQLDIPHLNQGPDNLKYKEIIKKYPDACNVLSSIYKSDLEMLYTTRPMGNYLRFFGINYLEQLS